MMGGVLKCRIVVASCWVCVCIHECVCVCVCVRVRACVSQLTVGLKVSCTVSCGELLCLQMQPALATWSATWLPNQQRGWWEPVHLYQRDICLPVSVMCHCMRQEDNLRVGSRQNCMVALLIVCITTKLLQGNLSIASLIMSYDEDSPDSWPAVKQTLR